MLSVTDSDAQTVTGRLFRGTSRKRMCLAGVMVVALIFAGLIVAHRQYYGPRDAAPLATDSPMSGTWWWSDSDAALETRIPDPIPGRAVTRAVPMRKGQPQGIVEVVNNNSPYPQTVVGAAGADLFTVQTSLATPEVTSYRNATYASNVTIPPGGRRYLRIITTPFATCVGYDEGGGLEPSGILLVVTSGWVTRTEAIDAADPMELLSQDSRTPASCTTTH